MELGFLHNSVVNQCKNLEKGGTISLAIRTAVRNFLTDYYGLIGSLHSDVSNIVFFIYYNTNITSVVNLLSYELPIHDFAIILKIQTSFVA